MFCPAGVAASIGTAFNTASAPPSFSRLRPLTSTISGCISIMDSMDSGLYEVMEGEAGL
ncbi:Uncharacterised protein [Vibrio cholerae]|nr:Uncharacterised protein [Vibrio cholerae]